MAAKAKISTVAMKRSEVRRINQSEGLRTSRTISPSRMMWRASSAPMGVTAAAGAVAHAPSEAWALVGMAPLEARPAVSLMESVWEFMLRPDKRPASG
jgi:hypothetical protein